MHSIDWTPLEVNDQLEVPVSWKCPGSWKCPLVRQCSFFVDIHAAPMLLNAKEISNVSISRIILRSSIVKRMPDFQRTRWTRVILVWHANDSHRTIYI
jgi:hypothetical protein